MSELEQRLMKDINQANVDSPDAVGIIIDQAEIWGKQLDLLQVEQFQEAMKSVDASISSIEGYLAQFPNAKKALVFTLARVYAHKGTCLGGLGHYNKNVALLKQGLHYMDKSLSITNWPPELKSYTVGIRGVIIEDIQELERNSSSTSSDFRSSRTSATPNTKSFSEVSATCPECGQRSTLKWREEKCASGAGACAFNMDKFESGGGLFCVKCGNGFHADTQGKGEGVLHCRARITASGPSGIISVNCNKPIPATPSCIKPVIREQKKGGCYIASATLKCGGDDSQLFTLRKWRNEVMRATKLGRNLEILYDKTGPGVASRVADNTLLAKTFLYPFVKPSIWLATKRLTHPQQTWFFNFLIYGIFLAGLTYGLVIYGFVSAKNSISA